MASNLDRTALLEILRSRRPLADVLSERGITEGTFQAALGDYLRSKLPKTDGRIRSTVQTRVQILRDRHGVPHISADNASDLFFAYGYATAQDRLWQLDFLRRAAHGRLAEILGPEGLASDIEVRTVGISRLARELVGRLPEETLETLLSYVAGVNAAIDDCGDNLPVEFDILEYRCEPWTIADTLALMKHFWWQLTGRLHLITGPALLEKLLKHGPRYAAFLRSEVHGESILPPGENRGQLPADIAEPFELMEGGDEPPGSNNWVIGPGKSATGHPLFASDPHTPYGAPTVWYEVHLHGAGFDMAGMGYAGVPGVVFGRNRHAAWGITNNICSLRDLFVYPAEDPSARKERRTETICIRNGTEQILNLATSDLGPIVNHLLPAEIKEGPPVALCWVGTEISDEIGALLRLNRAAAHAEFRESLAGWSCPTFNFVWADAAGNVAYECAGRLPRRRVPGRGLRPAADPIYHWAGFLPFEANPWCVNPKQGWLATANNPVLPADEDPGLGGVWTSDARARRIRKVLESRPKHTFAQSTDLQCDTVSDRAADVLPPLVAALALATDERIQAAAERLHKWDGAMQADSVPAALFEAFSRHWLHLVLAEREVPAGLADLLAKPVFGLAFELVKGDDTGWFRQRDRRESIEQAMRQALDDLTKRLGPDMAQWRWGDLHTLTLKHPLGRREPLAALFDSGPRSLGGSTPTVNNQSVNASGSYEATAGANCRVAADLGTLELHVTNCLGQSGHPGSPHYRDQLDDWLAGRLHVLSLDWATAEKEATQRLELTQQI
jgi:penicillin amidase